MLSALGTGIKSVRLALLKPQLTITPPLDISFVLCLTLFYIFGKCSGIGIEQERQRQIINYAAEPGNADCATGHKQYQRRPQNRLPQRIKAVSSGKECVQFISHINRSFFGQLELFKCSIALIPGLVIANPDRHLIFERTVVLHGTRIFIFPD